MSSRVVIEIYSDGIKAEELINRKNSCINIIKKDKETGEYYCESSDISRLEGIITTTKDLNERLNERELELDVLKEEVKILQKKQRYLQDVLYENNIYASMNTMKNFDINL
ncbi:MAG: hypothetical protein FWE18_00070 [Alphaproteobacteria bacterium]|nr:hypothetical protein [Alphaproteobacteria bacterium]